MKKKMTIAAALLALAFAPQAFSEAKGYVKATLGGGYTALTGDALFAVKPAVGVEWRTERADGSLGVCSLSTETSVGLGFGKNPNYNKASITVVDPAVMGIFSFHLRKFVPYAGLGLSTPMVFSDGNTAFIANGILLIGFGFCITENIMPAIEIEVRPGLLPYNTFDVQARAGCVVRLRRR